MPSWNIHTAHVEKLLAQNAAAELGIQDANAFLFGNYVPDIYVGYMVPDASLHIDYRITHLNAAYKVPVPDADLFWDSYLVRFLPKTGAGLSLLLGMWAHLATDRIYNGRFREYCQAGRLIPDDALRVRKQDDYQLFGRSLPITLTVRPTPELIEAARSCPSYSILEADVRRAIAVAAHIVESNGIASNDTDYQEVDAEWMEGVFRQCAVRLELWLATWHELGGPAGGITAADIRKQAGLCPARMDDPDWMHAR